MDRQVLQASTLPGVEERSTTARRFLQTLVESGVTVAFGIPGGTASPIFDALRMVPGLRYVATRHEAGAAFAALGYARATGRPALVLTTSGPGVTNTLTAVASAHHEELPVIVVSGEVPVRAHGRGALQDGTTQGWGAIEMMRPVTRWAGTIPCAGAAEPVAITAYAASTGESPGPVFVAVPLDVGGSETSIQSTFGRVPTPRWDVDERGVRELARALATAHRPLMVLGAGARGATEQTVALAERLAVPVAVTGHAKGAFPERHPQYLGIVGLAQHPSVDDYLAVPSDVTLALGTGLDDLVTNGWTLPLAGTAASFHVDRNPLALGRGMPFTHRIVGEVSTVIEAVLRRLPSDVARPTRRGTGLRRVHPERAWSDAVPLKPPRVLRALAEAFPSPIWCSDIGEHLAYALHYVEVDRPDEFHNFLGFGSMGSGVAAAIGMQLARPDRQVVCVCGDGGFSMMMGEVMTCVEQRLGVVFAVMNDGRWNMVEHGFRTVYGAAPAGFVSRVADLAGVANAIGAIGLIVESPADLVAHRLGAFARARLPIVLDIRIDASEALTPGTRAASIRHFCAEAS